MPPHEGVSRFFSRSLPESMRTPLDEDEVLNITTGMVGAALKLRLPSLSAPELGIGLPLMVTAVKGDLIRILNEPTFLPYKEKGQHHMMVTALAHTGEMMTLDTIELYYCPWRELYYELEYQMELFELLLK